MKKREKRGQLSWKKSAAYNERMCVVEASDQQEEMVVDFAVMLVVDFADELSDMWPGK